MNNVALVIVSSFNMFDSEYIGIARIDAFLKENHENSSIFYLDVNEHTNYEELSKEIPSEYNIIGFCIFPTNAKAIYKLAEVIKNKDPQKIVFVGGYLASTASDLILQDCPYIDFGVLGDGEETILNIVNEYKKGKREFSHLDHVKTRNDTKVKTIGYVDISQMPYPTRIVNKNNKKYRHLFARLSGSRGCTSHCSFCSVNRINSKWDGREIDDIFAEVKMLYEQYGYQSFIFNDSSFSDPGTLGKTRIRKFCNLALHYPVRLNFFCYVKAKSFTYEDAELVRLMRKAGFSQVFIGFEAFNVQDLSLYNKDTNIEQNHIAYDVFTSNGVAVSGGSIMINPFSTYETIRDNYLFLVQVKDISLESYIRHLEIYYDTIIYHDMKKRGLLKDSYSYINTDQYKFVDNDVSRLSAFIKNEIYESSLMKIDLEHQNFETTWYTILSLFPEETKKYISVYQQFKEMYSTALKEYFDVLYIERDICKARAKLPEFEKKVKDIFQYFFNMKLDVLKDTTIRSFILSNMVK